MANNKFDIKVFTDELNKAFTILKKEQVLEKYMKNVLLNYNSIIYIGNITDEPNKYNTIYNYMYGEDNTLCNIVIFETEGSVDSESEIIPSGIHIAYPYLDYSVCIDYKYILNINNSAELLTPTQEFKTINNESILGDGNIAVQEPLVSGTNIKTVNGNSLLGSGNIELSDDTVIIDIGTITGESGTISPTILSEINNAISENKNIVIKMSREGINIFFPNVIYAAGALLYATRLLTTTISFIMIDLSSCQYTMASDIELQEALVSGTNIKTINNQSILGAGNIKTSGSNSQIIDVSQDRSPNTSISNIYDRIINSKSLDFSSQLPVYTNIRTAINGGLVPILKFTDGYGYYKEYLSSSSQYVFILNHITNPEFNIPFNNIITLKVGSEKNAGGYDNLSQIPCTVRLLSDFGDSGKLDPNSSSILYKAMLSAENKFSVGIFILNHSEDKTYFLSSMQLFPTFPTTRLIAYTVTQENIEVVNLTPSESGEYNYTKTTYPLSGIGESNNVIKIIECSPGAQLDTDKLQKLQSGKYALYITGTMFYPTSDTKRFNTVPYFNYFGTSIQMCYESVAINQANYLEQISTYSIDLDIKKTTE